MRTAKSLFWLLLDHAPLLFYVWYGFIAFRTPCSAVGYWKLSESRRRRIANLRYFDESGAPIYSYRGKVAA